MGDGEGSLGIAGDQHEDVSLVGTRRGELVDVVLPQRLGQLFTNPGSQRIARTLIGQYQQDYQAIEAALDHALLMCRYGAWRMLESRPSAAALG